MCPLRKGKLFSKFVNLLQKGRKYLILVERKELIELEKEKRVYLGSGENPYKMRPAILVVSEEQGQTCLKLLFLTASRISQIPIDLNYCPDRIKLCSYFPLYPRSFLFFERKHGYFCIKLKTMELLEKVHYCGRCDNLEVLEKIPLAEL